VLYLAYKSLCLSDVPASTIFYGFVWLPLPAGLDNIFSLALYPCLLLLSAAWPSRKSILQRILKKCFRKWTLLYDRMLAVLILTNSRFFCFFKQKKQISSFPDVNSNEILQIQEMSLHYFQPFFSLIFLNFVWCLKPWSLLVFLRFSLYLCVLVHLQPVTTYSWLYPPMLSFIYSLFTLFHSRNANFVSFKSQIHVTTIWWWWRLIPSLHSSFLWLGCRGVFEVLNGLSQNQIGLIQSHGHHGCLCCDQLLHHSWPLYRVLPKSCPWADNFSSHYLMTCWNQNKTFLPLDEPSANCRWCPECWEHTGLVHKRDHVKDSDDDHSPHQYNLLYGQHVVYSLRGQGHGEGDWSR